MMELPNPGRAVYSPDRNTLYVCEKTNKKPSLIMQTEKRRSPRFTPDVQVGLMLIRDRCRPRGCRVRDYSEHGALLTCTTQDSRLEKITLDAGDAVMVRFWDRTQPGRSGEIKGKITRVMENELAIEYSLSGSASKEKLLNLLNKAVDVRPPENNSEDLTTLASSAQENGAPPAPGGTEELPTKEPSDTVDAFNLASRRPPRGSNAGLVLGVLAFVAMGFYGFSLHKQIDALTKKMELLEARQPRDIDSTATAGFSRRIAELEQTQQQMGQTLNETVDRAELRAAIRDIDFDLAELKKKLTALGAATTADIEPPQAEFNDSEWVVHLVTLSDPNAADKIFSESRSLGVEVYKSEVTIDNKPMHRLSIKGLPTQQDAEELAATVQQRLALTRKPWIEKR